MLKSDSLDIYQNKAVYTKDTNVLVVAPPGSGKTTVIVNRTAHLIDNVGVNADNIIVITFTKAAAVNMKKRYVDKSNTRKVPFFGTFHGLFYKILSRHRKKINIIDTSQVYRLVSGVLASFLDSVGDEKIKEVINCISIFKNSKEDMAYFNPSVDKEIFIECFRVYEEYKEENELMDFDDLQLNVQKLFVERSELLQGYRRLFKYLLIDEFQDCDSIQIELLQMIAQGNSIFAVGDEDQCIYGFRGSRPDCMVNFQQYFKEGKKIFLCKNYRSNENIVEISKKLIGNNGNRNSKKIEANKITKGVINFFNLKDEKEEALSICKAIEELVKEEKYNFEDFSVLYRTNMENRTLIDVILKKDIPFKILDKQYNFFEHFICKDLIAYLKLSLDITDKLSFIRIANKPFRYISKINIEKMRKNINKESCFQCLIEMEDMPIFQIKNLEKLEKEIIKLNKMHLTDALNFITNKLGYYDYINEYSRRVKMDSRELKDVIEEFKTAASDFNSIISFLIHIEEIKEKLDKKSNRESGVLLSTIHGVKGMEFKNVFIINCNEGVLPHINSIPKNIEEERRLFYVGITRAIDNLNLYTTNAFKGRASQASRFITESGLKTETELNTEHELQAMFSKGEEIVHKNFGKGTILSYEGNYVNIIFDNYIQRKFDAIVLKNSQLLMKNN